MGHLKRLRYAHPSGIFFHQCCYYEASTGKKNTLLTPCLFPSPRWASHLVQVKIEMGAKMSRLVRASGCGIGIESTWVLWWHPATHQGNVPQCHKSKSMTNSTCEVWWTRKKSTYLYVLVQVLISLFTMSGSLNRQTTSGAPYINLSAESSL